MQAHHALQRLRQVHGALPRPLPSLLLAHHQAHPGTDPLLCLPFPGAGMRVSRPAFGGAAATFPRVTRVRLCRLIAAVIGVISRGLCLLGFGVGGLRCKE